MRRLLAAAALAAALLASAPASAQPAFAAEPWLADLDQLRDAMTAGYANLEWQAERGYDLPGALARAKGRIEAAHDDYAARRAVERFLSGFGDGHLEVRWPVAATPEPAGPNAAPQPLCGRLGYFKAPDDGGPALGLPGVKPVGPANAHLKAATVAVAGRKLAILRVGMFSPQGYPDLCEAVARERGLTAASPCDQACRHGFERAADKAFIDEMGRQLATLATTRPDRILVDVAGNSGGNNSSLALARMVTAKPLVRPRGGGLRGPAWAAELADRQGDLPKAIQTAPPADRPALQAFDAALQQAHAEALKACDRSPLWQAHAITCTARVHEPLYKAFWSTLPEPDDPIAHIRSIWTGPLAVLVDGGSASSTEWFAAMLQDSRAATILGSTTFGAGCGHMTGAAPVKLAHSGGVVSMPDCWRLRANGENEAGGVEPDVLIAFREHDALPQRVARLARVLPQVLTHTGKP
jgi:hypothetical protein